MVNNKVKVKIYGQYYTIAGDKGEDEIMRIAAHVDKKMGELGRNFPSGFNGSGTIAVLTALNIADEYFTLLEKVDQIQESKNQMEKEREHYMQMWDEAKKSYTHYKEGVAKAAEEKKNYEAKYDELEARCNEFENSYFDLQMENLKLKTALQKYMESDEF